MQVGSFIIRKGCGDIGLITEMNKAEIRAIIVKGGKVYKTGDKTWMYTASINDNWETIVE